MSNKSSIKSIVVKKEPKKTNNIWCTRQSHRNSSRSVTVITEKNSKSNDKVRKSSDNVEKTVPREGSEDCNVLSDKGEVQPCEGLNPNQSDQIVSEEVVTVEINNKRSASPLMSEGKRHKSDEGDDCDQNPQLNNEVLTVLNQIMTRMDGLERRMNEKQEGSSKIAHQISHDEESATDDVSKMFDLGADCEEGQISDTEDVDFSSVLLEGIESEKKGKPLSDDAMKIVKNFFDKAPEAAVFKPLREKHVEPENCENLGAKDVNPEVFRCMKEPHKTLDFSVKTVQHNVASSSVASLRVIDTLTDMSRNGYVDREAAKYLLELVCDAAKLNSRAYQELSQVRKVLLKDLLSPRYRSLCFNKTFGNQLFGEDVSKSVKAIDDESGS